jgi:TonB family protein
MNTLRVAFFFGLLAVVVAIARCNSNSKSQAESPIFPTATATPQIAIATPAVTAAPTTVAALSAPLVQHQSAELRKGGEKIKSAVILVSVFDGSGKLLRTGSGFFVSEDGRFVTSKYVVDGAANAVAKTVDGRIYNVSGVLVEGDTLDVAVLKAETKNPVAFVSFAKAAPPEKGKRIGVIGSVLTRNQGSHFEATIAEQRSDQSGQWLELSSAIPIELMGSPVIDEHGEIIGIATSQHAPGAIANVVRTSSEVDAVLARLGPSMVAGWQAAQKMQPSAPPPAEGPLPTPPPRKQKIPLAGTQSGNTQLVYSPSPQYPTAARHSYFPLQGTGRFRLTFNANGDVTDVQTIQSTRSVLLDGAASETLRRWKAKPGRQWQATVPITFKP